MSEDRKTTTVRIFEKLEKIEDRLASMDITLVKQHASLEEHMKRTSLLESELRPVTKHVEQMRGAAKLMGMLALIATILSAYLVVKS